MQYNKTIALLKYQLKMQHIFCNEEFLYVLLGCYTQSAFIVLQLNLVILEFQTKPFIKSTGIDCSHFTIHRGDFKSVPTIFIHVCVACLSSTEPIM